MSEIYGNNLPEKIENVAFSGHRKIGTDLDYKKLYESIEACILHGAKNFYCGMAQGFDILAGECVLGLKKLYPEIKLIAYVPCREQTKYYSDEEIARYNAVLSKADQNESKVFFEKYTKWCMAYRNDRLVEKADVLIVYLREEKGGTAYTVKKFLKKKSDNIIRL